MFEVCCERGKIIGFVKDQHDIEPAQIAVRNLCHTAMCLSSCLVEKNGGSNVLLQANGYLPREALIYSSKEQAAANPQERE